MTLSAADLHVHTTCSDGRPTPDQLAERLAGSRLAVVAVTDHDTVEGALRVEEALAGHGPGSPGRQWTCPAGSWPGRPTWAG